MSWNFRVVHYEYQGEDWFEVWRIYYRDGQIENYTPRPYSLGSDLAELKRELAMMQQATEVPVLEFSELPGDPAQAVAELEER